MKIILSPAKKLNFHPHESYPLVGRPIFIKEAEEIQKHLREKSPQELAQLMNLSNKLAEENWRHNQNWTSSPAPKEGKPAALAFDGEVYRGLQARLLDQKAAKYLQEQLYIISGLYGLLKPWDIIAPYRLMMGTKLTVNDTADLYKYWTEKITAHLNKEMQPDEPLINLASQEYFKTIDRKKIKAKVIHCEFKDYKNDRLQTIMVYAKKARGSMTGFIAENNIEKTDDLKSFNKDGYAFDATLSNENTLVFTR